MLMCSMKLGPEIDGLTGSWHVEKVAGEDIVYTCPPSYLEALMVKTPHLEFENQIDSAVPQEVLDKLLKIPYFERGYSEDGYTADEFNTHPSLLATADQFSKATQEMVTFVGKRLQGK